MLDQIIDADALNENHGEGYPQEISLRDDAEQEQAAQSGYVVRLPVFEGPLDLLLHLIERNQLDRGKHDHGRKRKAAQLEIPQALRAHC